MDKAVGDGVLGGGGGEAQCDLNGTERLEENSLKIHFSFSS